MSQSTRVISRKLKVFGRAQEDGKVGFLSLSPIWSEMGADAIPPMERSAVALGYDRRSGQELLRGLDPAAAAPISHSGNCKGRHNLANSHLKANTIAVATLISTAASALDHAVKEVGDADSISFF